MDFTLIADDGKRRITISHEELDYLPDVMEVLLNFLQACGYTYVKQLGVVQDDNTERWTE